MTTEAVRLESGEEVRMRRGGGTVEGLPESQMCAIYPWVPTLRPDLFAESLVKRQRWKMTGSVLFAEDPRSSFSRGHGYSAFLSSL